MKKTKRQIVKGFALALFLMIGANAHAVPVVINLGISEPDADADPDTDPHYLGSVYDSTPASANAFVDYINNLISLALGTTDSIIDGHTYDRSDNNCLDGPCLDAVVDDDNPGTGDVSTAAGWDYLVQAYDGGFAFIWDISDSVVGDTITTPDLYPADSTNPSANWRAFLFAAVPPPPCEVTNTCPPQPCEVTNTCPPQPVPEPGTLALLGLGLFGLSISRRRKV